MNQGARGGLNGSAEQAASPRSMPKHDNRLAYKCSHQGIDRQCQGATACHRTVSSAKIAVRLLEQWRNLP